MTMSNGTSTVDGMRDAHGETANAACSSASSSASPTRVAVDRPRQVVEVEQPLGAEEPLYPVVKRRAEQAHAGRAASAAGAAAAAAHRSGSRAMSTSC